MPPLIAEVEAIVVVAVSVVHAIVVVVTVVGEGGNGVVIICRRGISFVVVNDVDDGEAVDDDSDDDDSDSDEDVEVEEVKEDNEVVKGEIEEYICW